MVIPLPYGVDSSGPLVDVPICRGATELPVAPLTLISLAVRLGGGVLILSGESMARLAIELAKLDDGESPPMFAPPGVKVLDPPIAPGVPQGE